MRAKHVRESLADAMHAALDDAAADVLDRRDEHPREVAAERIVGGEPGVQAADAKNSRISGLSKVSSTQLRAVCMMNR